MQTTIHCTLTFIAASCLLFLVQGCGRGHDHSPATQGGSRHLHPSKHNATIVEFPGHKYAMEIIDEKETTGLVTAFLTDAHFEPIEVDVNEVQLNFTVDSQSRTFTLTRIERELGEPATFTLLDMELATLNCEGWQGEATASVEIGEVTYSAKLLKAGRHVHGPGCNH